MDPQATASHTSYAQYPALTQYGGPSQHSMMQAPIQGGGMAPAYGEFEKKGQLQLCLWLSLAMTVILNIPCYYVGILFAGWGGHSDIEYNGGRDGHDAATFGYILTFVFGISNILGFIFDIVMLCSLNSLQYGTGKLTTWLVVNTVYMVLWFVEFILIIVVLVSINKLIAQFEKDNQTKLDTNDIPIYATRSFRSTTVHYYGEVQNGAIAAAVMGTLFLVARAYFQYIGFKVRKNLKNAPVGGTLFGTAPQQIVPQYPVGNYGGGGSPYYNNSNAYPPMPYQQY